MTTMPVQALPQGVGINTTWTACTASDKFAAQPGVTYILHYKNGATAQASSSAPNRVVDQTTPAPGGASPAAGWADLLTSAGAGIAANAESVAKIRSDRFIDANGFINLTHPGTLTTVQLAVYQV